MIRLEKLLVSIARALKTMVPAIYVAIVVFYSIVDNAIDMNRLFILAGIAFPFLVFSEYYLYEF
jgi:hypothetical protein